MRDTGHWTRGAVIAVLLTVAGCSSSKPTEPGGSNGGGGGNNTNTNSDTITVTVVLHGVTGTESLQSVAIAVGPSILQRGSATRSQLTYYENENGPGVDDSIQISVAKGQAISLFALEGETFWDDASTTYYSPTVTDTAIGPSGIEFVSWSSPCGSASLGDCQLGNLQSNTEVTGNFRRLKSLNLQAIGAGALVRTIQTRAPLSIAPVISTNPINGTTDTTSIFTDSAVADQYEVALFSGSQVTLVATELPGTGFTVTFDGWSGGCTSSIGSTCVVKWPANPGGSFVYSGPSPVPPPEARFQWYKCTDNGVPQVAQGATLNGTPGWSCSLQSP